MCGRGSRQTYVPTTTITPYAFSIGGKGSKNQLNGLIIDAILGYDEIIYFTHTTIESIVFFGSLNFGNE
jgi:hypothetical protein